MIVFSERASASPKRGYGLAKAGRSIPVVCMLWEHKDRVRFSAPRHDNVCIAFYVIGDRDQRNGVFNPDSDRRGTTGLPDRGGLCHGLNQQIQQNFHHPERHFGTACLRRDFCHRRALGNRGECFLLGCSDKNFDRVCFSGIFIFHLPPMAGDPRLVFLVPDVGVYNLAHGDYNNLKRGNLNEQSFFPYSKSGSRDNLPLDRSTHHQRAGSLGGVYRALGGQASAGFPGRSDAGDGDSGYCHRVPLAY